MVYGNTGLKSQASSPEERSLKRAHFHRAKLEAINVERALLSATVPSTQGLPYSVVVHFLWGGKTLFYFKELIDFVCKEIND